MNKLDPTLWQKSPRLKFFRSLKRSILGLTAALLIVGAIDFYGHWVSLVDRANLRTNEESTRKMLDARAHIQATLIRPRLERRDITEAERQLVIDNWDAAEYPLAGEYLNLSK